MLIVVLVLYVNIVILYANDFLLINNISMVIVLDSTEKDNWGNPCIKLKQFHYILESGSQLFMLYH